MQGKSCTRDGEAASCQRVACETENCSGGEDVGSMHRAATIEIGARANGGEHVPVEIECSSGEQGVK